MTWRGQSIQTAIWKRPVMTARVASHGLSGDQQADLKLHGGPDKAVYAYCLEDYAWWGQVLGVPLNPGQFGENLTTSGLDLSASVIGETWRIGTVTLCVTQPRLPCVKLGIRMNDPAFPKRFLAARRLGAYLRVLESGTISVGDHIAVVSRPVGGKALSDWEDG